MNSISSTFHTAKEEISREELVRIILTRIAQAIESVIGINSTEDTLKKDFDETEASLNQDGTITYKDEEIAKRVIASLIEKLTADFGYEFTESILEEIYTFLTRKYPNTITINTIFEVLPENSLEKEKVRSLSRDDLESHTFERTKELEELNARLESTVVERTKELVKTNKTLEEANIKLAELSKAKTEFLSFASHQLKNPLTTVLWTAQALAEDVAIKNDSFNMKNVSAISLNAEKMVTLINDLLNLARIEEGGFEYDFQAIFIAEVLNEIVDNFKTAAEKKSITVTTSFPGEEGFDRVRADRSKLSLVLENLLSNAIKYTPERKHIYIEVETAPPYLSVKFRDEGVGIPKEDLRNIFTKFYRASNVRSSILGTGLGLYLSKKIMEDHEGKIELESEEGKGTAITLLLPLKHT